VFISYVREDEAQVERLRDCLRAANVDVWLDKDRILPGMRWEDAIRQAISQGAFFIACFSRQYWDKQSTVMNSELNLAIEELRRRRRDQTWFIPVLLDDCVVPDWKIGPGETLRSVQRVDLSRDWPDGMRRIFLVLQPLAPPEYRAEARHWVAAEFRTSRALQVYDEWHSAVLHESRIIVSNFVELLQAGNLPLPSLSDFELAQRTPGDLTPVADHIFRVVHFFERWSLLKDEGLIDHALAAKLLGSYVRWYQDRLLQPLFRNETNSDFVTVLARIGDMAVSRDIGQVITAEVEPLAVLSMQRSSDGN
jgi:TIR domain